MDQRGGFTRAGVVRGLKAALALTLGLSPFGMVVGMTADGVGLSLLETLLMSGLVFAGTSQLVALQLWSDPAPILAATLACLVINLRMAPMGAGSQEVPSGRWSLHPDGYYVRYLPQGYSHTLVQIWVPQGAPAVGKEFDPATHVAVPGNTSRQRLGQSGRAPHRNPAR